MCPERRENLIHQSDFTSASMNWGEWKREKGKCFRQNGYFYIAIEPPFAYIKSILIEINDFKVTVDAEFVDRSSTHSLYGIVFRNSGGNEFYALNVDWGGNYCLLFFHGDNKWDWITPRRASEFIKPNTGMNSFMVEMVGQKMTVAANGHTLTSATDGRLSRGAVGLIVNANKGYGEVRFRNFRLYSIEQVEEALIMPAPMPAPQRRPTASAVAISIEKVTVPSSAKTPPAEKPRSAEAGGSAHGPPDLRAYLEGILTDAGMTDLTTDLRKEMIQELTRSLNAFMISEIIDHMPARHHDAFARLHEENRPQAEINRFIEEHMPNARQVFVEIFEKFRRQYGGKTGR